ncbi:MAG: hypothetical protein P8N14_10495 [Sulfitobacter sp.]|jgi:hypothetical protein|nr:hypothetical protein [Sulfitobacter sp.]
MTAIPDQGHAPLFATGGTENFQQGLIGAVVLLLGLAAAEIMFFGAGYYAQLSLHPFWIVILIAAMQHGVGVGFATVIMAAVLVAWPDRFVGESASVYAARVAVLPLQWLVVALIVGLYRQREIAQTDQLRAEVLRLDRMSESLAAEVERMDGMVTTLEREAAVRPVLPDPPEPPVTPDSLSVLRRALPELAALAGTSGNDLPTTFEAAAAALFDAPVALVVMSPDQGTLLMGTAPEIQGGAQTLADLVLTALEPGDGEATIVLRDTRIAIPGAAQLARHHAQLEPQLSATVIHFAPDAAQAAASAPQVEMLAEMTRIAIDRLSRTLAARTNADAGGARDD